MEQVIYDQEEADFDVPLAVFDVTFGMAIPTVLAVGDEKTKQRFVGPAVRGEEIWCQLFSEPAAGSDIAGVRTRAVRDGDEWVINGQKVWTSGAHFSQFGLLLARTAPELPKHKGLTMFWVDMKAAGIDVRPIHQMSGGSGFSEVYFTDVRLKDSQRLGAVNGGWQVALVTLMNERLAIGSAFGRDYTDVLAMARQIQDNGRRLIDDRAFRERLADWFVVTEGLNFTRFRTLTALSKGQTPGPEASIAKIIGAPSAQDLASAALDMQDQYGIVTGGEHTIENGSHQEYFLFVPCLRIAGGTDEILRNIIAERVLGLPGEPRADRDVAFKDLPGPSR
jgi:alkylation response protein AidB-like acyl-CoA dehydrogenase